jgi:MFS family permease
MNTGTLQVALNATTAKWFVRRRGFASAVSGAGGPLGFVGLPLAALLAIELWGWREAWLAMGVILFLLAVPTSLLLMAKTPESVGQVVDGDKPGEAAPVATGRRSAATEVQWTAPEAMKTITFWILLTALLLRGLAQGGVQLHLVPHLEDAGFSRSIATMTFLIGGTLMAISGFFWGPLSDRMHVRHVFNLGSVLFISYVLMIIFASNLAMVIGVGVLQGVTIGATVMIQRVAYANFFGRQSAGAIQGVAMPFQMVGSSAGGLVAGLLYGIGGSYDVAFWVFVVLTVFATALMAVMPNPAKRDVPSQPVPSTIG